MTGTQTSDSPSLLLPVTNHHSAAAGRKDVLKGEREQGPRGGRRLKGSLLVERSFIASASVGP